jgi:dipeptidyl aminopeptidase/acylaminoacyl peptidase
MKTIIAATLAAAAVYAVSVREPQAADPPRLSIDQLIDIKHPSNPSWSPDGRHIVFNWDRAGVTTLYVSDLDGREPRALSGAPPAGATWSTDSLALQFQRNGELWQLPIGGGEATAVAARSARGATGVASPDGARVAFVRPAGGSSTAPAQPAAGGGRGAGRGGRGGGGDAGPSELWVRTLDVGQETRVATEDAGIGGVSWSPDGAYVLFTTGGGAIRHEQTPAYSGAKIIYTITENTPGQTFAVKVAARENTGAPVALPVGGFGGRRWLDASHIVFDRTSPDFKRRTTYLADIAGGEPRVLHEDVEPKFWSMTGDAGGGAQPSPDGKWIAFLSDRDGWDHLYIMRAPATRASGGGAPRALDEVGEPVQITKGRFEAWRPVWSRDGTRIAFDANEPDHPGDRHLGIVTLNGDPTRATVKMITSGRGTDIAPNWSPDGTRLVYQHTDAHNSADLYVIEAIPNAKPIRLTDSMPAGVDRTAFVEPELVHYAGPDGQSVPAWLFVPKNLDRSRKHPAIVWIHGDGVNQSYDGWHVQRNYAVYYSFHQYLLQKGYVVIAPEYRGSIGYGKAWREGVYMDVGGNDAKDAWMVTNYLKTLGYVDMERVGVWGLSYGGFFTLIAVTDQPRLFRAAVDVAGVVDYAMYYEDPYHGGWTASRIGTPEQNPEVYAKASPLSHVDRLERPLLVLHGTSDVNVPYLHSVRLIDELMKNGKGDLVTFMMYPGEFHYFTRAHVLNDAWHRVEAFFDANLNPGK